MLIATYVGLQLLIPLRHYLYPGKVSWTEEGHRFAWHMKLRDKDASADFIIVDPVRSDTLVVDPRDYLTRWQARKMSTRPDMILQFSHYLAEKMRHDGHVQVEVRAEVTASLNGRRSQVLIDPTVDLARQRRTLKSASWILPLEEPLRTAPRRP